MDCGNTKITQHVLKVRSLQNVETGHCTEDEEEEIWEYVRACVLACASVCVCHCVCVCVCVCVGVCVCVCVGVCV